MKIELLTLQDSQQPQVKDFLDSLKKTKDDAISKGNEEVANNCWRKTEALKLNIKFIEAFSKIKEGKFRKAWNELEKCEITCNSIEKNSSEEFLISSRTKFIKNKVANWQSLYPYCVYVSPAFIVGYYTCSICDHKIRPRSRCKHVKGKVYNGELCVHVAHDLEFRELSIVTNPVQKYSVMHNDETLDFSLIKYLSGILEHAFEEWDFNWTKKSFPIGRFSKIDPNNECPCKSGNKFTDCCLYKEEVEIPHIDFILNKEIPMDKAGIKFPY